MNKQEIHEAIKDYHWMIRLLMNQRQEALTSNGLTAKYGIEASLPKPNTTSDPVYQEFLRIEKYESNTIRLKKKVMFLQKHSKAIRNTKDKIILDKLLDGMSMRDIAVELGMSLSGVKGRKDNIVHLIYESAQKERNERKAEAI